MFESPQEAVRFLKALSEALRSVFDRERLQPLVDIFRDSLAHYIQSEGEGSWLPLKPRTVLWKYRRLLKDKPYPSNHPHNIRHPSYPQSPDTIMFFSGRLLDSFDNPSSLEGRVDITPEEDQLVLEAFTMVPYYWFHQFGALNLPARPMRVPDDVPELLGNALYEVVVSKLREAGFDPETLEGGLGG